MNKEPRHTFKTQAFTELVRKTDSPLASLLDAHYFDNSRACLSAFSNVCPAKCQQGRRLNNCRRDDV
jgi:hypothetical protein